MTTIGAANQREMVSGSDFAVEFRRCVDDLSYRFEAAPPYNGRAMWKRVDLDLYLGWSDRWGWIIGDSAGTVVSRPWDIEKSDQGLTPPEGMWVSRLGAKSYVYISRHLLTEEPVKLLQG